MRNKPSSFLKPFFKKVTTLFFPKILKARKSLKKLINFDSSTDYEFTISTIESNINIKGSITLILFSACILASIGLDTDSPAVIIGAMLISPLMSPILGIGLGVGIFKKELLLNSVKNFSLAVALSLLTSTIYFAISPLGEPTSEIIARTKPTLLDIGVAFFGGLAGIIALSRKGLSTIIPGVAIATALMPPLCTSGFGIATGDISIFLGAFYLFFLNTVFISLATYLIVRILDFPYTEIMDVKRKFRIHRTILLFVIILSIPSVIILYQLVSEYRSKIEIESIISSNLQNSNTKIVNWEIESFDNKNSVKVFLFGKSIPPNVRFRVDSLLQLKGYSLDIINLNITDEEKNRLTDQTRKALLSTLEANRLIERQYYNEVDSLKKLVNFPYGDSLSQNKFTSELRALFPQIENIFYTVSADKKQKHALIIQYKKRTSLLSKRFIKNKLESYIKQRFPSENIVIAEE
ncbi:MAG: DUF389 domain-containing protein [Ignavibacteriales bacterium]|nr:MAG: DUF389 domain-containing protein [Ignavibacteriales bacterium]